MAIRVLLSRVSSHGLISNFKQSPTTSTNQGIRFSTRTLNFPAKTYCEQAERCDYRQLISLANVLRRYGFPSSEIHDYLEKNRFLLNFSLVDVEKSLGILLSFRLSQKSMLSVMSACPGVLELGFLKKWEMGFLKLGFSSVSPLLIQSVLENCKKLKVEPCDIQRSLQVLKDLSFSDRTVTRVLEEFPRVMRIKTYDINCKIEFFKRIGFRFDEIDRIIYSFPSVLGLSVEDRLKPLFKEFDDLGFTVNEVMREVIRDSKILSMEIGELSRYLDLLKELKCRVPIEEKILRLGAFGAGVAIKLRVDCLCRHGLIRREALKVLQREPRLILYELEDMEKKIQFLTHKMGFKIGCLIEVPEYLGINFDKQIVPRYNVIEYLRSKGGLGMEVGLKGLIKPSRLRFYNLYVKPYPECEKMFGRFSGDTKVKTQHPAGLWKLFKPPSYPESEEDIRNIKLFMKAVV